MSEATCHSVSGRTFFSGAATVFVSEGAAQAVRFASNIVLTRLLVPEYFGIMALVNIFIQGLEMFSDLGIGLSVIQHKDGEKRDFLDSAWTLQVVRSAALWVISAAIAWPLAWFYGQRDLIWLLPWCAFGVVLNGVTSVSVYTANRRMQMGRITALELGSQIFGIVVTILWAWRWPGLWALAVGRLAQGLSRVIMSYVILEPYRPHFQLVPERVHGMVHFGKWVFLASVFGFVAGQGDRLVLGKYLDIAQLGVYGIAYWLSMVVPQAFQAVSSKVLFPLYARLLEADTPETRRRMGRLRAALLAVGVAITCGVVVFGADLVQMVYDERYWDARWMLPWLAVGALPTVLTLTVSPVFLAAGESRRYMTTLVIHSSMLLVCMIAGAWIGSTFAGATVQGMVGGIVVAQFVKYAVVVISARRYAIVDPRLDAVAFAGAGVLCGIGFLVRPFVQDGLRLIGWL